MYPYKIFGDFDLYMICITLGAAGCLLLFRYLADRVRLAPRLTNLTLVCGVVGMGVGYGAAVLFQAFYDFLAGAPFVISAETGATFYGGLIGGAAGFLALYFGAGHFLFPAREHLVAFFSVAGLVAPAVAFAHALGRVGCLMVGCCYGAPTDAWYGVYMHNLGCRVIPTQLIEAVFLAALCALLVYRALRGGKDGFPLYLVAYGFFRFFIEYLRADDRGASPVPFLSPSQLTSLLLVAVGFLLLLLAARLTTHAPAEKAALTMADTHGAGEKAPAAEPEEGPVSKPEGAPAAGPDEGPVSKPEGAPDGTGRGGER